MKKSAEEFMRDFFCARTVQIKKELENRAPFRQKFFTDDCFWDSHSGAIERSESEMIVSSSSSGIEAEVVTQETDPFPKLRYHLQTMGESWLIRCVDVECLSCRGSSGNIQCFCKGKGWLDGNEQASRIKLRKAKLERDTPSFRHRRF
jgi:hypothetical protein